MNRQYFFDWVGAVNASAAEVGGKGHNLARLHKYGFPVPVGGVLTARAYHDFLDSNGLTETVRVAAGIQAGDVLDPANEKKLAEIRCKIKAGEVPETVAGELTEQLTAMGLLAKPVAVRSSATAEDSATASFAGIHDSFLNVTGPENVYKAVKDCYASLWSPRAVAYRRKQGLSDDEVAAAVVIMEMVEAKAAGVAFSCDPHSGRQDVLVINANYGLGESVVSGAVEPDEYRLKPGLTALPQITDKKTGRKEGITMPQKDGGTEFVKPEPYNAGQVLEDDDISRLGLLILRVFDALGQGEQHQDIEWVFDGNRFILVQARPVTVLPRYIYPELQNQPDIWSNGNFRDVLPMVQSTLNCSMSRYVYTFLFDPYLKAAGYRVPEGLPYLRLFHGRAYLNLSLMQWCNYDACGITPRQYNTSVGGHQPEIGVSENSPYGGLKGLKRIWRMMKLILACMKANRNAGRIFDTVGRYTAGWLKKGFKSLSENELIDTYNKILKVAKDFAQQYMLLSLWADTTMLTEQMEKYFPGRGSGIVNALLAGGSDITSAQHGYRIVELAEIVRGDGEAGKFLAAEPFNPVLWAREIPESSPFKQSFYNFLEEYGHRGVYELDIINPRWREDHAYLLEIIKSTINTADSGKIKARQKEAEEKAWQEIKQKVPWYRRVLIKDMVKRAQKGAAQREMAKSVYAKIMEIVRLLALEIGSRFAARGIIRERADIFHCASPENLSILIGDWDGKGLDILVAERKVRKQELEAMSPPDVIVGEVPQYVKPAAPVSGNGLAGIGVAAGRAAGTARIIYHPHEGSRLQAGDVLVAPSTDPGWTPLFLKASAIVTETGGVFSHGAIVAREYGIPAVVNIPGVLKIIKDGQQITVDGDGGKVFLQAD